MNESSQIGVAVIGDVLDINCWSNIPYYFYTTGKSMDLFNEPWSLDTGKIGLHRKFWNLKQILSGHGKGGYQYSKEFLCRAEGQIAASFFRSTVISFSQVFPRASTVVNAGGRIYYYIDATLHDLFNEPSYGMKISAYMREEALRQERENFQLAQGVVTMGKWCHDSLRSFYGLPESKIFQILPGANLELPPDLRPMPFRKGAGIDRDLILGFIGKDWRRKGLPFLLEVRDHLTGKGYKVKVKAVGNCPEELVGRDGLEYTGFINKQVSSAEFVAAIASCDIGCLFTSAEALGISTLEFLRVGVPVAGFYHQGLVDTLLEGASLRFEFPSSANAVADLFESYIKNEDQQHEMKRKAIEYSGRVTWDACLDKFRRLLHENDTRARSL